MRACILALWLVAAMAGATEVSGVKFAPNAEVGAGPALVLNGAGVRKRVFVEVYAMGLYLAARTGEAAGIPGAAGAKRVQIHMLRDVGADQFTDALAEGMRDNHDEAAYKVLEGRVRQLQSIMAQMKEAKKGTRILLDWVPAAGTRITIDGKVSGPPIAGEDFYRALLRIWLGENPVSADLKKALLGGS